MDLAKHQHLGAYGNLPKRALEYSPSISLALRLACSWQGYVLAISGCLPFLTLFANSVLWTSCYTLSGSRYGRP